MAIVVSAKQLGAELRARARSVKEDLADAQLLAAQVARSIIAPRTPVYTGAMKARWRVGGRPGRAALVNDAPYAGIIEKGARPHGVSIEGRTAIKRWFMRKLGLDEREAAIRTEAFCQRLMARGQEGTFFVRGSLPEVTRAVTEMIVRVLRAQAGRRAG